MEEHKASPADEVPSTTPSVAVIRLLGGLTPAQRGTLITTVRTLLLNAVTMPEAKYRTVRANNKGIRQRVVALQGGVRLLVWAGFLKTRDPTTDEVLFQLPRGTAEDAVRPQLQWLTVHQAPDTLPRPSMVIRTKLINGRVWEPAFDASDTVADLLAFVREVSPHTPSLATTVVGGYPVHDLQADAALSLRAAGLRTGATVTVQRLLPEGREPHAPPPGAASMSAPAVGSTVDAEARQAEYLARRQRLDAKRLAAEEARRVAKLAFQDDRIEQQQKAARREAAKRDAAKLAPPVPTPKYTLFDVPLREVPDDAGDGAGAGAGDDSGTAE